MDWKTILGDHRQIPIRIKYTHKYIHTYYYLVNIYTCIVLLIAWRVTQYPVAEFTYSNFINNFTVKLFNSRLWKLKLLQLLGQGTQRRSFFAYVTDCPLTLNCSKIRNCKTIQMTGRDFKWNRYGCLHELLCSQSNCALRLNI